MKFEPKVIWSFGLILVILVVGIIGRIQYEKKNAHTADGPRTIPVMLGGQTLNAVVADTPALQEKGLSGTSQIEESQAMLFVFDKPGKYPFWMRDMKYSIDIIWMDQEHHIVHIKEHAEPSSFPKTFGNEVTSASVLEVSDGFVAKNGVKVGDEVLFTVLHSDES